jgi:hypothetical protein
MTGRRASRIFIHPFYHGNVLLDLSQENYENLEDTESIQNFTQQYI